MQVPQAARSELTPKGKLRVGLNYGNFLLVLKDGPGGEPRGIAPDLGRELGRRLGVCACHPPRERSAPGSSDRRRKRPPPGSTLPFPVTVAR